MKLQAALFSRQAIWPVNFSSHLAGGRFHSLSEMGTPALGQSLKSGGLIQQVMVAGLLSVEVCDVGN